MEVGEIFFFTTTINQWKHLLKEPAYSHVILDSLQYLCSKDLADVFAFVIMPNHVHLIWRTNRLNGKETVQGSFLKYTAHRFKQLLNHTQPSVLNQFAVDAKNKKYEFWQRDPLAVHLYTPEVAYQKLNYIHMNPLAEHWQLATDPSDYFFSSASFYEKNERRFAFIKDLRIEMAG
jgi:REP element-mobilizing transposase RayT